MISIGFGLACLGIVLLSLSMKRHYRQAWPDSGNFARWARVNRVTGYGAVALALVPCVVDSGPWIGLVLWISMLAGAAFLQTMLLTWWPRRSLLVGGASVALVVLGLCA
jgi:hypothetical protein